MKENTIDEALILWYDILVLFIIFKRVPVVQRIEH